MISLRPTLPLSQSIWQLTKLRHTKTKASTNPLDHIHFWDNRVIFAGKNILQREKYSQNVKKKLQVISHINNKSNWSPVADLWHY
jgi:hypothetical protein